MNERFDFLKSIDSLAVYMSRIAAKEFDGKVDWEETDSSSIAAVLILRNEDGEVDSEATVTPYPRGATGEQLISIKTEEGDTVVTSLSPRAVLGLLAY
jgi:hypothetical protein